MPIGEFDRRITLVMPVTGQNGAGETVVQKLRDVATVWARVRQPSASEQVRNNATSTVAMFAIRIRYREDVNETWQLRFEGRTLLIASVMAIGRRDYTDLVATEVRP